MLALAEVCLCLHRCTSVWGPYAGAGKPGKASGGATTDVLPADCLADACAQAGVVCPGTLRCVGVRTIGPWTDEEGLQQRLQESAVWFGRAHPYRSDLPPDLALKLVPTRSQELRLWEHWHRVGFLH